MNVITEAGFSTYLQDLFHTTASEVQVKPGVDLRHQALATAAALENAGADKALVGAGFLRDIGHVLANHSPMTEIAVINGQDVYGYGARFLERFFLPGVTEPIRLQRDALRYLIAVDGRYRGQLSSAELRSLHLQGGMMGDEEILAFERSPYHSAALQLLRFSEQVPEPNTDVTHTTKYLDLLNGLRRIES